MATFRVQPGGALTGRVRVPGDKSISHRAVMLGAIAEGRTDDDGRCRLADGQTGAGQHRLVFATGAWFARQDRETFYPEVVIAFAVREPERHHHVPLLLAPFAYSTYRGS